MKVGGNMKNFEHIKYTFKHRKIVMLLAEKYFGNNQELLDQVKAHDLDKMYMYLFYDKKDASNIHRDKTVHHENELEKTELDYIEMVLDWESARYTKPDKPLNAYDTLVNYYPQMTDVILPILKKLGIAESGLEMDQDILEAAKQLDNTSEEDVVSELVSGLELVTGTEIKQKIKKA